jgi:hypothetical protein
MSMEYKVFMAVLTFACLIGFLWGMREWEKDRWWKGRG